MAYAADQVQPTAQYSPRTGSIIRFVWHHQAGTNDDSTIAMMVTGSKQLSATYTVSNDDPGGRGYSRITQVVPDEYRPWTSSSATADGRALTAEVANSTGDPDWGIADATHEACARLAAYAYVAHGVPLKRATAGDPSGHMGHNEVIGMFGEGYSTSCPMHLDIDRIISRAAVMVGNTDLSANALNSTPLPPEDDMDSTQAAQLARIAAWIDQQPLDANGATPLQQILGRIDGHGDTDPASGLLPAAHRLLTVADQSKWALVGSDNDPSAGLRTMVGGLYAQIAGLTAALSAIPGGAALTPAQLAQLIAASEAAAKTGATEAIANLTLVAKP
jgi:hypothetical protein